MKYNKGVTLVELLVVMVVSGLIVGIILNSRGMSENKTVVAGAEVAAAVLNETRSLTLSSKSRTAYGVHVASTTLTIYPGPTYSAGNAGNKVTDMHSSVGIRAVTLNGGGQDILFKRLTGETDNSGTFEVYLLSDPTQYKTISIGVTGVSTIMQ
jgi:prepilin-type N-terminal cleavage/methylation domain-containing protein